jgi:hypothetical protein
MKIMYPLAAACAAALAASAAGAQTYSTYPSSTYPGYGYNSSTGLVRCESVNSRSNFCRVDTRGGVEIVRQLSRERCVRGRNWEVRRDGIVVDDGCRAEFAVGNAYASGGYGGYGGYAGTDRYGQPLYTAGSSYVTDRYGNRIYVSSADIRRGYVVDRRGNRIMLTGHRYANTGGVYNDPYGTTNGYYSTDRYGNRIWVTGTPTSSGYYTTDRYGNRVWVAQTGASDGYYTTDRYGNRVFVPGTGSSSDGYYTTDRYGNRVFVPGTTGSGGYYTTDSYGNRVYVPSSYEGDSDPTDGIYERNRDLGPYQQPYYGGTTSTPTTTGTSVIYCTSGSDTAKTYCGDNTQSYTIRFDSNSKCLLNRTYGRDSGGTWVSGGCSLRLEPDGY